MIFVSWNYVSRYSTGDGTIYRSDESAVLDETMPTCEDDLEQLTFKACVATIDKHGYGTSSCTITNMIDLTPSTPTSELSDQCMLQVNQEWHKSMLAVAFAVWLCEANITDCDVSNSDRLSWLLATNGGFDVTHWGNVTYANLFQSGLYQNEAIELLQLKGFIDGVALNTAFDPYPVFMALYSQYRADNGYPPLDGEPPPKLEGKHVEHPNTDT